MVGNKRFKKMMFMNVMLKFLCDIRFALFSARNIRAQIFSSFVLHNIILITIVFSTPAIGDVFMGAKVGKMMVDDPTKTDPINIAVNIGYELDTDLADLSLVGEVNRTINSGKTRHGSELDFESNSIFLVWKTTGSLFVTLRGGVVQNELNTDRASRESNGILIGGSLGTVIGRTRLQLEYTSLAGDANFFGIGLEIGVWTN